VKQDGASIFKLQKSAKTVTRRGDSSPPTVLAKFIELLNAERLYEREMEDIHGKWNAAMDDSINASKSPRFLWVRLCEEYAKGLQQETRAFLGPVSNLRQFLEAYELLSSAAKVLKSITKAHAAGPPGRASELLMRDPLWPIDLPFTITVELVVDEQGLLAVTENPLLKALQGVPVERLRSCAICRRYFWALRINSECCSERCRKTYNQRNSRDNRRVRKHKRR
jgi:hypothetical protein